MPIQSRDDARYRESINESLVSLSTTVKQLTGLFDLLLKGYSTGLLQSDNKTAKQWDALDLLVKMSYQVQFERVSPVGWDLSAINISALGMPEPMKNINWLDVCIDKHGTTPLFNKNLVKKLKRYNINLNNQSISTL
tara:strand:- start:52 stop:462 length:411 start_codon:yes stop_codon:yes gene_type:complete